MTTEIKSPPRRASLPASFKQNSGKRMSLTKGNTSQGKQLYSWDMVQDCTDAECPAFQYCDFSITKVAEHKDAGTKSRLGNGKCYTQLIYLRDVVTLILGELPDVDQITLFKVGSHLIPLYSMWARLKIAELGVTSVVHTTPRGGIGIHPIYRELRETAMRIEQMWEKTGLESIRWKMGNLDQGPGDLNMREGNNNFYDRVMNSRTKDMQETTES